MPELPEVEAYRRLAETSALGRVIGDVHAPDSWYLKRGAEAATVRAALTGHRFVAARRIGKVLLLDTDAGPTLGLRFGMTGRLLVDDVAGVDKLKYSSSRHEPGWDRFVVEYERGGRLAMRDPRRLGGVELDPDEGGLGYDALAVTPGQLSQALHSHAPLKARLMDQSRIAGIGNLLADEILWRARLDPARPSDTLDGADLRRLHRHLRGTVRDLMARGGSHTGDLGPARAPGGRCPRDGAALVRRTVGGRTTWSCPVHQL